MDTINAVAATRSAPTPDALDRVGNSLDNLDNAIAALEGRLEPISTPEDTPPGMAVPSEPRPPSSQVVNRLVNLEEHVRQLTSRVERATMRLEV